VVEHKKTVNVLLLSIFLAVLMVSVITVALLSRGLPENASDPFSFPASKLTFAFGSGDSIADQMLVEKFDNGYALLSSGPVSIQAEDQHILGYTIQPSKWPRETAFFWRRSGEIQDVKRAEITTPGSRLIDLSLEPDWRGEISEFGFLLAGDSGETVEIGDILLVSESLKTKLQMTWQSWTTFEEWSQKSINFLYGGDRNQIVSLPLLVTCFLLTALSLFWIFSRFNPTIRSHNYLHYIGLLFLLAWIVVDIRWSANNVNQIRHSIQNLWTAESQQTTERGLDEEIENYAQKLKNEVLGNEPARIVIIGDENAEEYYLLRAKYYLLPHSINVVRSIGKNLSPSALDFVVFIGEPGKIRRIRGWDKNWQNALIEIDRGEWGVVYRVMSSR
jgi:hypothetical protein